MHKLFYENFIFFKHIANRFRVGSVLKVLYSLLYKKNKKLQLFLTITFGGFKNKKRRHDISCLRFKY